MSASLTDPSLDQSYHISPNGGGVGLVPTRSAGTSAVVDTSDVDDMSVISELNDSVFSGPTWSVTESNRGWIADVDDPAIHEVDLSNPSSPTVSDTLSLDGAYAIRKVADTIFLGQLERFSAGFGDNKFTAVDVSNPGNMSMISTHNIGGGFEGPYAFEIHNDVAYIPGSNSDSLATVDVSDPANMSDIGIITETTDLGYANDVAVDTANNVAYVTARGFRDRHDGTRLTAVDVSDPASMSIVSALNDAAFSELRGSTLVSQDRLLVSDNDSGNVCLIDVSDPSYMSVIDTLSSTDLNESISIVEHQGKYIVSSQQIDSIVTVEVSE